MGCYGVDEREVKSYVYWWWYYFVGRRLYFTIVSLYFCYQIDFGDVLVVVLMMKSLWVIILIFLRISFSFSTV